MTAAESGPSPSRAARLGSSAGILLSALEQRAELAMLEMEEAGQRVTRAVLWAALAAIAALLAGLTLTVLVAAIFWDDPYRVAALAVLGLIELGIAGTAAALVIRHWQRWQLFTHLRDQLTKDCACIREVLTPDES